MVVKVVARSQATHEARVLRAVGARKDARAIQVLSQLRINDADVGLVTPYCPGKLFAGSASLRRVLRQAMQLCEVRRCYLAGCVSCASVTCTLLQVYLCCVRWCCWRWRCQAVMAWHAAGVLHLDLKPSNVATTADGDVVVLDAGISVFMTDGSATVRGGVGTPGYQAPELRGSGHHVAVAACDVYSLGVTYRRALDAWAEADRFSKRRAVRAWGRVRV